MSNQHQLPSQVLPNLQYMNASAPVSSLLPQISSSSIGNQGAPALLSGHQAASLQAQLASLLTQGSLNPALAATNAAISAQSQLLASRAAPTLLSSTANKQDFTLDQLGESSFRSLVGVTINFLCLVLSHHETDLRFLLRTTCPIAATTESVRAVQHFDVAGGCAQTFREASGQANCESKVCLHKSSP
jgi:hypothetical protein